jgi:hypothetical protein
VLGVHCTDIWIIFISWLGIKVTRVIKHGEVVIVINISITIIPGSSSYNSPLIIIKVSSLNISPRCLNK